MLLQNVGLPLLFACALLAAACAKPAVPRPVSIDSLPPSMASQPGDRYVPAGEWEYVDGAVVRLALDEQGNSHYDWENRRFETDTLIGHTWHGMWFQEEDDRDVGYTVEFSPDFSEGERHWWYSSIGANDAPTQKSGTFHLGKKTALYEPQ